MKTEAWVGIVVIILIIGGLIWWGTSPKGTGNMATTTTSGVATTSDNTGSGSGQTTTSSGLNFSVPAGYALATSAAQLGTTSYIPPCSQGFEYCIYKHDSAYAGTNFESAGVMIKPRSDLASEQSCLTSPPAGRNPGYSPTATMATSTYSVSVFADLGDAAAGHSAIENDYRLYNKAAKSCAEVDTRIGQSTFANYPAGSIKQFTTADQQVVAGQLQSIVKGITLNGAPIAWPINIKTSTK